MKPPVPQPAHADADIFIAAVNSGDPAIVRSAIEHGVSVNQRDRDGISPIVLAVVRQFEPIVDLLLASGADVNQPDRDGGMTALHAATLHGNQPLIRKLLAVGANVNARLSDAPFTPLALAVRRGHAAAAALLLDAGADANVIVVGPADPSDRAGTTVLIQAASAGNSDFVRLLLGRGADPNLPKTDGVTPLMAAAYNGYLDTVRLLVDGGARVAATNPTNSAEAYSALDLAVAQGHRAVADYLRSRIGPG